VKTRNISQAVSLALLHRTFVFQEAEEAEAVPIDQIAVDSDSDSDLEAEAEVEAAFAASNPESSYFTQHEETLSVALARPINLSKQTPFPRSQTALRFIMRRCV
jgi:hypothetical protein